MDCVDGKTGLCFPILSAWIADHAEHAALDGIGSKSCPKCEDPSVELGGNWRKIYQSLDCTLYWEKAREQDSEEAGIAEYFQQVGVKIGRNVFTELYRVNPVDLHKPDHLHNIYLGLFKRMIGWVEGFLKKHKWQEAFDDSWKEIPPYPRFPVPNKAYCEVTQWQEKEMRKPRSMHFSRIGVRIAKSGQFSGSGFEYRVEMCWCTSSFLPNNSISQSYTGYTCLYRKVPADISPEARNLS